MSFPASYTSSVFINSGSFSTLIQDIVLDTNGNFFLSDFTNSTIYKRDSGGNITSYYSNGSYLNPTKMAFDANNNLYAAFINSNTVIKITPGGSGSVFNNALSNVNSLCIDFTGTYMYAVAYDKLTNATPQSWKINMSNGSVVNSNNTFFGSFGTENITDIVLDKMNNIYIYSYSAKKIYKADTNGNKTTVYTTTNTILGFTFNSTGRYLVSQISGPTILFFDTLNNFSETTVSVTNNTYTGDTGYLNFDQTGNLYFTRRLGKTVYKINNVSAPFSTLPASFPPLVRPTTSYLTATAYGTSVSLNTAQGMQFDTSNNLYIADTLANQIDKVPTTGSASTFYSVPASYTNPTDVCLDLANYVYALFSTQGTILKINPTGVATVFITGLVSPAGCALDKLGNTLYVVGSTGKSYRINVATATIVNANDTYFGSLDEPYSICLNTNNDVYISDISVGRIRRSTTDGGSNTIVATLYPGLYSLALDSTGRYLYGGVSASGGINNGIYQIDTQSSFSVKQLFCFTNSNYLNGGGDLTFDTAGNLYFVDRTGSALYRIPQNASISSSFTKIPPLVRPTSTTFSAQIYGTGTAIQNIVNPGGMTIDRNRNLYIVDISSNNLVLVPFGSASSILYTSTIYTRPSNVCLDGNSNVYIAYPNQGSIVRISSNPLGSSSVFVSSLNAPSACFIEPSGNFMYVVGYNNNSYKISMTDQSIFGGNTQYFSTGLNRPVDIKIDFSNNVYISNYNDGKVLTCTTSGGATTTIATLYTGLVGCIFDSTGRYLYASVSSLNNSDNSMYSIDLQSGNAVSPFSFVDSNGVVFNKNHMVFDISGYLYVYDPLTISSDPITPTFSYDPNAPNNNYVPGEIPCFREGSQILCFEDGEEIYIPVEQIRTGTLVKTIKNSYVPVYLIGTKKLYNPPHSDRIPDRLYVCRKEKYPELLEDLYLTGNHSILEKKLTEEQTQKTMEVLQDIYITDDRYRLLTYLDERSEPFEEHGIYSIYHFALENPYETWNYGVYANGLIVETCSKEYIKKYAGMQMID